LFGLLHLKLKLLSFNGVDKTDIILDLGKGLLLFDLYLTDVDGRKLQIFQQMDLVIRLQFGNEIG
jgi:hypothetical protein